MIKLTYNENAFKKDDNVGDHEKVKRQLELNPHVNHIDADVQHTIDLYDELQQNIINHLVRVIIINCRQSEFMLGYYFGVEKDNELAALWYKRAANRGHNIACLNLGVLYESERDYEKTLYWYHRAYKHGNTTATFHVGRMFWSGKGCNYNEEIAFNFFLKAAKKGNIMAISNVAAIYMSGNGRNKNYQKAWKWIKKVKDTNNAVVLHNIGLMYYYGKGVHQNKTIAKYYFQQAQNKDMEYAITQEQTDDIIQTGDCFFFT